MNATQRGILAIAAIFLILTLVGYALASHGQSNAPPAADSILQPLAPVNVPESGTFFMLSGYLDNGGSLPPPYPFNPDTNGSVYSLNTNGTAFIVDDTAMTNDAEALDALTLLLQPQDTFSSNMLNGRSGSMTMDSPDPGDSGSGTNSSDGGTYSTDFVESFPTNELWISVPTNSLATAGEFYVLLENTVADSEYDVLTSTNVALPLLQWSVAESVYGAEDTNCTPVQVMMNGQSNLFVSTRFGGSSDGSGMPDWWEQEYGLVGVNPYTQDPSGDGWTYLQDYLNGYVPGTFNTPPPVQNVQAYLDSSGNVVVTWQPAPGVVTGYTVSRYDFNSEYSEYSDTPENFDVGLTNRFVDTTYVADPVWYYPVTYSVTAHYPSGDSGYGYGSVSAASPCSLSLDEQVNAQAYMGPGNTVELAVSDIPSGVSELEITRVDWDEDLLVESNYYGFDDWIVLGSTNFAVPASSFTNGPYVVPSNFTALGPNGSSWLVQAILPDGSTNEAVGAGYFGATVADGVPGQFNDASAVLVQNAIFQIRAAGLEGPFSFYEDGSLQYSPSNYVAADLCDQNSGSGSPNWSWPFTLNFRYANFASDPSNLLYQGVSIMSLNDTAETFGFSLTNTTALPGLLTSSATTWIVPHSDPSEVGISDSGSQFTLSTGISNYFGMRLLSVLVVHSNASDGLQEQVLPAGQSLSHGSDNYYFYPQYDQPQLQTVGCYFNRADGVSSDPAPGYANFSTTNVQPYLVIGSPLPMGWSITISAYSKQIIANGDTSKPIYISQYFDKAYMVDTNGNITTQETGILSPYGFFFPSQPGKVAFVTLPDENGQRWTDIVQIISFQFDANHDGTMDLSYYGPDCTWRSGQYSAPGAIDFWVNDDFDRWHSVDCPLACDTDEDDLLWAGCPYTPDVPTPDCNYLDANDNPSIPCNRDLEDYARLWIPGLTSMIASLPTNYTVQLESFGDGSIRLFQAVEPDGGTNYLFDPATASNQVAESSSLYVGTASQWAFGGSPIILTGRTNLTDYFIMCGAAPGEAQLILQVLDQNGNQVTAANIYFNLKELRDMYERWTVGDAPAYAPTNTAQLAEDGFPDYWNSDPFQYEQNDDTNTPYILFVHGWNMPTWEKDKFADAAFRRLYWCGYTGRFGLFRWPTDYGFVPPLSAAFGRRNYDNSEFNAWKSATGLYALLVQLNAEYPGHVYMLAHSMGNVVAGEALRLPGIDPIVNTYVASQAAVPAHVYDGTITNSIFTSGSPVTPNIYTNYFASNIGAVGRRINFFNTNDFALGSGAWELDQTLKPDQSITTLGNNYNFEGYPYDNTPIYTPGSIDDDFPWRYFEKDRLYVTNYFNLVFESDYYEVMSYAAQARSPALGRTANVGGLSGLLDLQTVWPPDTENPNIPYSTHKWHSAEFRSDLMQQQNYWRALLYTSDGFNFSSP